ncbi:rhamnogalacturonan acetylesterase [Myceligenerans crystallogenes]|uniref:Rhamnogalacturonan acetylesterase n=1 Tax=Myceligenerans crystallogenes TaxID=316335 RepID=A0ABP4ZF11_9MICO
MTHFLGGRRPRSVFAGIGAAATAVLLAAGPAAAAGPAYHPAPRTDAALLEQCAQDGGDIVCTYADLAAGHYDVTVFLGDADEAAATEVRAEARRLMVAETPTAAGELTRKTFTVNVRTPEAQQNRQDVPGEPGLTLRFTGGAPAVARIGIAEAPEHAPRLFLGGDSTVTDQDNFPYTGWGQRLPAHFRHGLSVVNYSGGGESTVSYLSRAYMFGELTPQLRSGDVVLFQLAHNDKTTTAADYRANLTTLVEGVRARGAQPVLVTPIVRCRFTGDQLNDTGLIRTGEADLPEEIRGVAAGLGVPLIDLTAMSEELVEGLGYEAAKPIYLIDETGDRTHTSEYGASVYAGLVAGELRRQGIVPERFWADDDAARP